MIGFLRYLLRSLVGKVIVVWTAAPTTSQPPANAEQPAPYLKNDRHLLNALKNKDVVFFYDVPMIGAAAAAGCSRTVLAYEKGAPTKGGWVVLFDGSARLLDPTEFKKFALPK